MAGSLTGDWAELDREMGKLIAAERNAMHAASVAMEAGVDEQYAAEFAAGRDPFGAAWKPTKKGGAPLVGPTLQLANPVISQSRGLVKLTPVRYWVFHQAGSDWGSGRTHTRQILPYGPSKWDAPIERKIGDAVERHFR